MNGLFPSLTWQLFSIWSRRRFLLAFTAVILFLKSDIKTNSIFYRGTGSSLYAASYGMGKPSYDMEGLRFPFVLRVYASTTVRAITAILYLVSVQLCLVLILERTL